MKRILVWVLSALTGAAALAAADQDARAPARGPDGFLPVPAGPLVGVPLVTNAAPRSVAGAATNAEALTTGGYVLDDKHKLLAGDRVSFQIIQDRTNAIPLLVAESLELDIPYIGRISVAGKTCKDLADDLKTLLEKDYYHKATVIIGLDALTKVLGKVYVWGAVRTQGAIEIPANENFTAGKAIGRAGGFGDFANKKNIEVIRTTASGKVTLKVNMVDVLEKGKTESDVVLEPEDYIIVHQRSINW